MSVEGVTAPALARLRQTRGSQEALVRRLQQLAPLLLAVYVAAGFAPIPAPA